MKKKIMAVTLCLAMVSTFAVGCGQKNETDSGKSEEKSSGKVEIEFVQVKREAAESYTKVIEAFEKENPDIVIKQNVVPDAQEVLMTRASSDSLPDMMNHWPTDAQFVQFEDEGLLLDLSEKDYMKNIDSKYLDAVKAKDGKNYIAPYNVNFMGVYYNKDKFEEAGYTMPTKWDELIALAEEIKAKGETPFILPNKDSWTVSNLWSNIEARDLGSHEDEFEKMKAGEESFETIPEYKSSVEKMIQLLDYANEDSLALGYDQAINDFANGEGWMFLQGSWTLPSFLSANPDFNVEFTILPNDNGKPIATQAVDTGFCVNAKVADEPEKMEAIDKFLSFALSAEGAQIYTDNDKSPSCVIDNTNYYTKVEDAVRFVEQTGCDSLAIAVGNAHGPYVKTPNLDLERIYAIRKKVNIPLVLHGCSDIPEEQMKEAVNLGMSKFNIATEYFRTMYQSIEKRINNQEFEGNGVKLMYDIKEEMIDFVIQKIRLLNPNKYSM